MQRAQVLATIFDQGSKQQQPAERSSATDERGRTLLQVATQVKQMATSSHLMDEATGRAIFRQLQLSLDS